MGLASRGKEGQAQIRGAGLQQRSRVGAPRGIGELSGASVPGRGSPARPARIGGLRVAEGLSLGFKMQRLAA